MILSLPPGTGCAYVTLAWHFSSATRKSREKKQDGQKQIGSTYSYLRSSDMRASSSRLRFV
jgi:hypothetical protein